MCIRDRSPTIQNFIDSDFGADRNLIDSIFEAESIPTIIPGGRGRGPMVLDHHSPRLTSANDLHDLFIANYDSSRRPSGKTIILYNYRDIIML